MFSTDILETDLSKSNIKSYYSSRTEALLGVLLSQLGEDKHWHKDPFATANIIVPNSGMQRFLELKIAEHFGIFAQIDIAFPSQYLRQRYEKSLGNITLPAHWDSRALAFSILAYWQNNTLTNATLAKLLEENRTPRQRYGLATQIAQLFSNYLNERPEIITAWHKQHSVYGGKHPHEQWQMQLFNDLQLGQFSREALQQKFHQSLEQQANELAPVHIFGFHSLPPLQLADFSVLSRHTDIFAYVFNPSTVYWQDIVPEKVKISHEITQEDEDTLMTVGNPLLASWGQAGKYLIEQLNNQHTDPIAIDEVIHFKNDNMLNGLQNNIQQLKGESPNTMSVTPDFAKKIETEIQKAQFSLSLHVAASPRREVEILYDYLCQLFVNDRHSEQEEAALNPADILVMVPDLRDYAPHIQAVFGSTPHLIPFSLANQKAGSADAQVQAFLALIAVIDSDFQAQALFDAMSETHIRQHFGLSLNDLETLRYWLIKSRFAQRFYDDNHGDNGSLEKLLDALLLAAIGGDDCCVYFDDTERQAFFAYQAGQRDTLDSFCTIIAALLSLTRLKRQTATLSQWKDDFIYLAERFLGEDSRLHQRLTHWYQSLTEQLNPQDKTDKTSPLAQTTFDYETVRTDLVNLLENEDLHGPFLSGGISFCAMVPMRSIPARMICLLGLNHNFPAIDSKNPLDLRQQRPLWSDKKANKEHKYFFLETLMATREKLYLSYVGKDEKTGEEKPASILVDELWSAIRKDFPDYAKAAQFIYPIQGYLSDKNHVSYQALYKPYSAPQKNTEPKHPEHPILPTQLKANELVNALIEPLAFYLKKHLHSTPISADENSLLTHDFIAKESGIDDWQYNHAILQQALFGKDAISDLKQRNYYAPDPISQALLKQHKDNIEPLINVLQPLVKKGFSPLSQFISQTIDEQRFHLLLDIPYYGEQGIWHYSYGNTNAKHYLRTWVNHILLNLLPHQPCYESQLFTLNKGEVQHYHFQPLPTTIAQSALQQLLSLYQQFFEQPHAIELSYKQKNSRTPASQDALIYQDKDYPLYPELMKSAITADNQSLATTTLDISKNIVLARGEPSS